jgi:hypothetical protein
MSLRDSSETPILGVWVHTTTQGQHKMQKDILVQKAGPQGWSVWDKYSSHESYTLLGCYATNREALDKAFALSSSAQKRNVECHIQIDCTGE